MKILPHFVWELLNPCLISLKKTVYQEKLNRFRQKERYSLPEKKILVLAHSAGIGNAVEATPLVQAIRMLWPNCHLTFFPPSGDLFSDWCVPDRIITYPENIKGEIFDHAFAAYIYEDMSIWEDICRFDKIHFPKIWYQKWFLKKEREYYLDMLRSYGFKGQIPPAYVSIKKPTNPPPYSSFRFCIAPCGKSEEMWKFKKWPYYPELIELLCTKYPQAQICIIGTKSDELLKKIPEIPQIIDLRGLYSLSETAWLMKHSDFVIGNDCGPMHIADTVQTAGVVIFGPTCVVKNGPTNKLSPIFSPLNCYPCQYSNQMAACLDCHCINKISAEDVLGKILTRRLSMKN